MKTDKLQRLEKLNDLYLLKQRDIIESESHGDIAVYEPTTEKDHKKMTFVGRGRYNILKVVIDPQRKHIIQEGKISFGGAFISHIPNEGGTQKNYSTLDEFLKSLEM